MYWKHMFGPAQPASDCPALSPAGGDTENITMLRQNKGFVNGEWCDSRSGDTFTVLNPYNDQHLETVQDYGVEDVENAIDVAHDAFQEWRKSSPKQRSGYLRKIGDLMLANRTELAAILTSEQGKPLAEANGEVGFAASFFHFYSEECKSAEGEFMK